MDFTNCKRIFGKAYNGANGKKISIEWNDKIYMLKFPPSGNNRPTELSYTNSCFSEHLGSSIFNACGIEAQKTFLGTYEINGKIKVVCACEDFVVNEKTLYDFCSIKNTIIDSEHQGTGTELDDLLETIEKQQFVNEKELLEHFWNVFIIDALLGNFDRHNGNWGFLYDHSTGSCKIAPVFDCGSCLLPQADGKTMERILKDQDELNARIYSFPTSAIKNEGKKINYYDFISSLKNDDCNKALLRMIPRIDVDNINKIIDDESFLTTRQKIFYKYYINQRYEKILLHSYRELLKQSNDC